MATLARKPPAARPRLAYRRILVPVEGRGGCAAVSIACRLAAEHGGTVSALAVIEVPSALPLEAHMPEEEAEAMKTLTLAEAIGDQHGVRVERRVARARLAGEAIVGAAEEADSELIVLWAQRRLGLGPRRPVFGKTVRYVLQHARRRVLVSTPHR